MADINIQKEKGSPGWNIADDSDPKGSLAIYRRRMEKKGFLDVIDDKEQKDGIGSNNGYVQSAKMPKLAIPTAFVSSQTAAENQESLTEQATVQQQYTPAMEILYVDAFNKQLQEYKFPNGQLLTTAQKDVIRLLQRFPKAKVDARVIDPETAKSILSEIAKETVEGLRKQDPKLIPEDWTPPHGDENGETFNETAVEVFDTRLAQFMKEKGLLPETTAKLRFALFHPKLADKESADLLHNLGIKEFTDDFFVRNGVAMPPEWSPPSERFDANLNERFEIDLGSKIDDAFTDENIAKNPKFEAYINARMAKLSPPPGMEMFERMALIQKMQQQAKTLYYHPDAEVEDKEQLLEILKNLKAQAMGDLSAQGSIPKTVPSQFFKPDVKGYDAMILGHFRLAADRLLQKAIVDAQPPLSAADINLLKNALNDPKAKVPDRIHDIAEAIRTEAADQVHQLYGVETIDVVKDSALWTGSNLNPLKNAVNFLNDTMNLAKSYLPKITKDSDRVQVLQYMKMVGEAIIALQEMICKMETQSAIKSKELSQAQSDAIQSRLEKTKLQNEKIRAEEADAKEKADKAAECAGVMKIVMPIMTCVSTLITIASLGTLGPVAMCIMIVLTVLSIADQVMTAYGLEMTATQAVCYGIGYAVSGGQASYEACMMWGAVVLIFVTLSSCALTAAKSALASGATRLLKFADAAARFGATVNTTNTMLTQTQLTQHICKECNLDKKWSAVLNYSFMVLGIVATLGTGIVSAMRTQPERLALLQARLNELSNDIRNTTSAILKKIYELERIFVKFAIYINKDFKKNFELCTHTISTTMNMGVTGIKVVADDLSADSEGILADVAKLKAQLEAWNVMQEDLIQMMRELVKRLIDILGTMVSWGTTLNELQVKKYDNLKNIEFVV